MGILKKRLSKGWALRESPYLNTGSKCMVKVKFFATLRQITKIHETVIDQEGSVGDILEALIEKHNDLKKAVFDEKGDLYIKILLNGRNIDYLSGLETQIRCDDTLYLFPPIAGG